MKMEIKRSIEKSDQSQSAQTDTKSRIGEMLERRSEANEDRHKSMTGGIDAGQKEVAKNFRQETSFHLVQESDEEERKAAMREIRLYEYHPKELEKTKFLMRHMVFMDGCGKARTYEDAMDEMLNALMNGIQEKSKEEGIEIPDQRKKAIREDAEKTLLSQQTESSSRGIGSHGIPHLYSVYERMDKTNNVVLDTAARQLRERNGDSRATQTDIRTAMILSAIYHDEGYLSEIARRGMNVEGTREKQESVSLFHGVDSAIAFRNTHRNLYEGIVDKKVLDDVEQAILEHNVLSKKKVDAYRGKSTGDKENVSTSKDAIIVKGGYREKMLESVDLQSTSNLDPNESFIRSALLLSDKLALDSDEKIPDVLREREMMKVSAEYYWTAQEKGLLQGQLTEAQEEEKEKLSTEMRMQMVKLVSQMEIFESQKRQYIDSVEKDMSVESAKFNLPMLGIATPSDSLVFKTEETESGTVIRAEVTVFHRMRDPAYVGSFGIMSEEGLLRKNEEIKGDTSIQESDLKYQQNLHPEEKQIRKLLEDLGAMDARMSWDEKDRLTWELIPQDEERFLLAKKRIPEQETGELQQEKNNLENVTIYIQEIRQTDADPLKTRMTEALTTMEEIMERHRATYYEANGRDKAIREFFEKGDDANIEDILKYLGAIYEDTVKGHDELEQEVAQMCKELKRLEIEPSESELREITQKAQKISIKDGEKLRAEARQRAGQ